MQKARLIHYESPMGIPEPPKPIALFKAGLNLAQHEELSLRLIVLPFLSLLASSPYP